VERAVERFLAVACSVIGASHLARADDRVEGYDRLHRSGRPGALASGALHLVPGAAMVAAHGGLTWPGAMRTAFGWLLTVNGLIGFLAPDMALRSMERGPSRAGFIVGGLALTAVGTWAGYCLWQGGGRARRGDAAGQPARAADRRC
jgi:hypothetical protein